MYDTLSYPASIKLGGVALFEASHELNLPFITLSSGILIVALLAAWYSSVDMLLFSGMMLLIEIFLIGAFSCTNLFVFLLFFEASALPIFILIAYCGSARRERLKASYYFLFFTLYGSLSLLLLILNFYGLSQISFNTDVPLQSENHTL
jgi:NADH-quinone oxidoreductase subunit M